MVKESSGMDGRSMVWKDWARARAAGCGLRAALRRGLECTQARGARDWKSKGEGEGYYCRGTRAASCLDFFL
jgi:hypothetical protein